MAPAGWEYLPQAEEDALHNVARLLSIEARPYHRVSGALNRPGALDIARPAALRTPPTTPPTDASASDQAAAAQAAEHQQQIANIRDWQNDIMDELSLFDYAILRMEFSTNSNQKERERYAEEKKAITDKQQHVKENIDVLRDGLKVAKETLEVRKTYDELTDKIMSNKMLKSREEQLIAHTKLDEEIGDLQHEVESSKKTWAERRMQFGRIEEEAKEMLRMIKDEKEEAERKEGMMKDGDELEDGEASTTRGGVSQVGTPRPDGGATPLHNGTGDDHPQNLRLPRDRLAPFSRDVSAAPSARSGVEDVDMVEATAKDDDTDGMEEGEEEEGCVPENMDES